MRILISNDDGIYAEGIHLLAKEIADVGHEVVVCAPDRERSATGHAMTMARPLFIRPFENTISENYKAYECDGMPTDCVSLSYDVLAFNPDLMISGINFGPNVSNDVTYSGTVCAAMEGLIFNTPSVAVSLNCSDKDTEVYFASAISVVINFIKWFEKHAKMEKILYNINVPNLPLDDIQGVKLTSMGCRSYNDRIKVFEENGCSRYLIGGVIFDEHKEGTDVTALRDCFVSVTPIKLDMTDYEKIIELRKKGIEYII